MKFTPGPWHRDGRAIEALVFDDSWKYICDRVKGSNPEEADANCDLIAAAPDLYAALQALMDDYCQVIGDGYELNPPKELVDARAALIKAVPPEAHHG
jgi:hypothetical protein